MPTLYTHADSNIRRTWLYMGFFLVFVILICWLVSEYFGSYIVLYIGIAYSVSASFFGYWYSDKIVLKMTGAKPIEKRREGLDKVYLFVNNDSLSVVAKLCSKLQGGKAFYFDPVIKKLYEVTNMNDIHSLIHDLVAKNRLPKYFMICKDNLEVYVGAVKEVMEGMFTGSAQ